MHISEKWEDGYGGERDVRWKKYDGRYCCSLAGIYGTECTAVQVPRNVYHTFIPHADGTVIFEAKDRAYDPVGTEEFLFGTTEPRR